MAKNKVKVKPWSMSTTVRNPERIRSFLSVFKKLEGEIWNKENQRRFQILLIQYKFYGAGEQQFYKDLSKKQIALMDDPDPIEYEEAEEILNVKKYVGGGDMRGRQSFKALEKMGLAYIDNTKIIRVSDFGNYFLAEGYDLGEVFFRSFLKWQLPNPNSRHYKAEDGYNIKPFIATLHLINEVNKICQSNNSKVKGISQNEFGLFGLTLINYKNIQSQAKKLYKFRLTYEKTKKISEKIKIIEKYKKTGLQNINGISNLETYTENVFRYFRLTRYFYYSKGRYLNIEPRRKVEISTMLKSYNGSATTFASKKKYQNYLCDLSLPVLPWENLKGLTKVCQAISIDIIKVQKDLFNKDIAFSKPPIKDFKNLSIPDLKKYNQELRDYRKYLQQQEIHFDSQQIPKIEEYAEGLKNIYKSKEKKSIELERLCSLALNALNDAIEIKPNYDVGDDNEPTFTAGAGKPDIECYYQTFDSICEVTMLVNRDQWHNEGQPVMRHLRDFEIKTNKESYCLFIAPKLHRDTINTYFMAAKYEYEGIKQKIVPITINQFLIIIEVLIYRKKMNSQIFHHEIKLLFDNIISLINIVPDSVIWGTEIPATINDWKNKLTA